MASKLCDSCQSATATLYCRTDSAFLCVNCDSKIHAASWLLPNPKAMENPDLNSGQYLFQEMDPYLDLDYGHVDPKLEEAQEQNSCGAGGVVPVQSKNMQPLLVNDQSFELDFSAGATQFQQPLEPYGPPPLKLVRKSNVGVLAFEIAGLMSKLIHLWQALSDRNIIRLHNESISLEGVPKDRFKQRCFPPRSRLR